MVRNQIVHDVASQWFFDGTHEALTQGSSWWFTFYVARVSWEILRTRIHSRRFFEERRHEFDNDQIDYQELQFLPFHAKHHSHTTQCL